MNQNIPFQSDSHNISLAIDAVKKAGKQLIEFHSLDYKIETKLDKEPVTEADLASDKIIHELLSLSEFPVLSEESFDDHKSFVKENKIWIVDPLDGTADFINKTGEFTIMISLISNHVPEIGIIYSPVNDMLFVGEKDHGAFKLTDNKWAKLVTSDITDLQNCRVVGSRHHLSQNEKEFLDYLNIKNFKTMGSSLKVANIAQGWSEFYFTVTDKMKQWDTAASFCIINEAGGSMTDIFGNKLYYNTEKINHENGILVSNGAIHSKVIEEYKKFSEN